MERHWRRRPNGELAEAVEIAVEYRTGQNTSEEFMLVHQLWRNRIDLYEYDDWQTENSVVRKSWVLRRDSSSRGPLEWLSIDFELSVDGALLLRWLNSENQRLELGVQHCLLSHVRREYEFANDGANAKDPIVEGDSTLSIDNVIFFNSGGVGFEFEVGRVDPEWLRWVEMNEEGSGFREAFPGFAQIFSQISYVVGHICKFSAASMPNCEVIPASRQVPTVDDLTYFEGDAHPPVRDRFARGDPRYRDLALAYVDAERFPNRHHVRTGRELADRVNRALSEHLFVERGYRIDAELHFVVRVEEREWSEEGLFLRLEPSATPHQIVRLNLKDAHGISHSFADVGSGIGYVLPVLTAVYNLKEGACFVQQPELHLHPALQASMADALIEAASAGKQVLIETHSEHLLLRALRRVRQTHAGVPLADALRLTPDLLAVLYLNPSADGSTEVRNLRVTLEGDFLDSWPRGFFTERDAELFDE
ncbi:hypothetical protein GCM10028796_31440 [Ramlibacter monticola]|uniref:AAA family ATPase n=1 Tax=Ramlibacter monticola TaxID=1926872 RepID=A0A936Z3C9_9BURK|nr:AAA family ATPase [Ramlibacter monticola]MBL0394283.1 AAA family ATPase [Ramlibacter monticola]